MEKIQIITAIFLLTTLAMMPLHVMAVGENMNIRVGSEVDARSSGEKSISIGGENIQTSLRVELGNQNRVLLSNGLYAEIRIMPSVAAETAIARVRLNACSEENNCVIELKEIQVNREARASYEVQAQKEYKVFGLFRAKANVETNVNAETGAIIATKTPWWTTISTEVKGEAASQAGINT